MVEDLTKINSKILFRSEEDEVEKIEIVTEV